ncbi:MAG: hypothetical protein K8T89_12395 [Planctomycetes bacterium]|nr:hypothetical protein [Planctomycetota bacterium]
MITMQQFTADHRYLQDIVARQATLVDVVLVNAGSLRAGLIEAAKPLETLPIDGIVMTSWDRKHRQMIDEMLLGLRTYELEGIRFAVVKFDFSPYFDCDFFEFIAVGRQDCERLRSLAQRVNLHRLSRSS